MKRKADVCHEIEPKVASFSNFLREEALDVNDIDKDVDDFLDCYNKFVKYITEVYDKKEKTSPAKAAHFILKFKELNRKAQFRLNISREKTKETKDSINKNHLTMQNLLYEALHLEKETNSCLEYKSLHEDIDIISLEEFAEHAPLELQNSTSEHELTLNRLHWELCERKNLSAKIEEAEQAEQRLIDEINKKKIAYADISTHLKTVLSSTETLEEIFEMPMHHQENQNQLIETLPEPLYILYTQMRVHADLDEQSMTVTLVEENNEVCVRVELTECGVHLTMTFFWDSILSLLSVQSCLEGSCIQDLLPLTKCLMDPSVLLSELSGDYGNPLESPCIRSKLSNQSSGIQSHGLPYLWCQRLAGSFVDLNLPQYQQYSTSLPSHEYSHATGQNRVPPSKSLAQIFEDIRYRIRSRLCLATELATIISGKLSNASFKNLEWTISTFAKFKTMSESNPFVSCGLATSQCFFYTSVLFWTKYQKLPLNVWMVIPHDYPNSHPFVVLSTNDITVLESSFSDATLKQALHLVEVEVNCYCDEFPRNEILVSQISRLYTAMDLMFEQLYATVDKAKLGQLFVGSKLPSTKRPFKSSK